MRNLSMWLVFSLMVFTPSCTHIIPILFEIDQKHCDDEIEQCRKVRMQQELAMRQHQQGNNGAMHIHGIAWND